MKKRISLLLMAALLLCLVAGCGQKTDWAYIEDKGTLVMGITLYEPMNYYDENGELTGFDTEFAQAVCKILDVEPVFQEIEWDQKQTELKGKSIDCIWNGLTISDDLAESMAFSTPYVENKQVVIIKKENADKYKDLASMKDVKIAVESGSAGEKAVQAEETLKNNEIVSVSAQKDALLEVKAGTVDMAVLDYVLAKAVLTDESDYSDMMMVEDVELGVEEYGIGVRLEDTELLEKINDAIQQLKDDGTLDKLAEKYNVNLAF
jgi:polar amino acid transport system substrate-binding protein